MRKTRTFRAATIFGLLAVCPLLSAPAVWADCTDFAGNQVLNCSFEEGDPPVDWIPDIGDDYRQRMPGIEGLHAASLVPESTPPFGYWAIKVESECFPVAEDSIYRFGGYVRRAASMGTCRARIQGYDGDECAEPYYSVGSPSVELVADEWLLMEGEGEPYGQSARFSVTCVTSGVGGPAGPEVLVDGAFAVPLAGLTEVPDLGAVGKVVFVLLLLTAGFGLRRS